MLSRLTRLAVVLAAGAALIPAGAQAASIWTPLNSGTNDQIMAIAAPKEGELVFVTGGGEIRYLAGGTFASATVTPAPPLGFTDVAMSPDGVDGVAVGRSGAIYRSTNSGVTWTSIATAPKEYNGSPCNDGGTFGDLTDDLFSVKFADATDVYVTGADDDVLKSTDTGATFSEGNKNVGNTACLANAQGAFTDTAWIKPNVGFLLSNDFGLLFATTNGFTSASKLGSENVNGFDVTDKLAVDPSDNGNDMWATSNYHDNGSHGGSFFQYTTDGGNSWSTPKYDQNNVGLEDIADVGTTVVTVGLSGDIYTSPDGVNFFRQIAAPPYTATDWHAVAMVPGTATAFVGGANGALVATASANAVPDTTAPTGTISGPTKLNAGKFGSYIASAVDNTGGSGIDPNSFSWDIPGQAAQAGTHVTFGFSNPGTYTVTVSFKDLAGNPGTASISIKVSSTSTGSSPVKKKSGGSTVTIYKKVQAGKGKGRFIPVHLATKKPRRFIVTLLTKKGNHQLATLTTKLKKGKKTVHLRISSKVKSGTYKLVVIVLTTGKHSHPVGGRIKQVFVLS